MCTLTVVPLDDGRIRLAFNRDEQRSRPEALLPHRRRFGSRDAILPIDPVSGGTWLAVNDAGIVLALLNVTSSAIADRDRPRPGRSRGEIIPSLLPCVTLDEVLGHAQRLRTTDFAPFRLVILNSGILVECRSDGRHLQTGSEVLLRVPYLFTSSGLGDHFVEGPRRHLFEEMFADPCDPVAQQNAFHRHCWPGREHLSVCMSRCDARTVSCTTIEVADEAAVLTYFPDSPDRAPRPTVARIVFQEVSVR